MMTGLFEKNELLEIYFRDIHRYPLITREEEIKLAIRKDQGDKTAAEDLFNVNAKFVVSQAKKYYCDGMDFIDLINEGNAGLIKGIERFDHRRGYRLISYASHWIKQKISSAIKDKDRIIRLPSNKQDSIKAIHRINNEYFINHGVNAPIDYLEEKGFLRDEIFCYLDHKKQIISIHRPNEEEENNLERVLKSHDEQPDHVVSHDSTQKRE